MTTFFIADTHLGHRKVAAFLDGLRARELGLTEHPEVLEFLRRFPDDDKLQDARTREVAEVTSRLHDEALIRRWNAVVAPGGTVWCLGDMAFYGNRFDAQQLHGTKLLVKGNHDRARTGQLEQMGWVCRGTVAEAVLVEGTHVVLTHAPVPLAELGDRFNTHGHLHTQVHRENGVVSRRHLCVSVEQVAYQPLREDLLLACMLQQMKGIQP